MGTKANHLLQAQRLKDRAEECRALARIFGDRAEADSYLKLAESYDALAADEEAIGAKVA